MIGYITIGTNNLAVAGEFYDALLAEIGSRRVMTDERMLGWGSSPDETMFSVIEPFDGNEASIGNGVMVALNVGTPEQVEAVYQKVSGMLRQSRAPVYDRGSSMGFYGGYFRDLDGNKLVAYCLGYKPRAE